VALVFSVWQICMWHEEGLGWT